MAHFKRTPEFERDLKKLLKKFRTLEDDINTIEKVLRGAPEGIGTNFVTLHTTDTYLVVKARLACRALRGERALRLMYAYHKNTVTFYHIELYHKANQANQDKGRIDAIRRELD